MSVAEIMFVVAGLLVGLAFQGGMFLFAIPFAVVALLLGMMNRPRLAGPNSTSTATLPVISFKSKATGTVPVVSPDLRSEFRNENGMINEPESALKVSQVWARANADINKGVSDILRSFKAVVPHVNTIIVFTQMNSPREWGVRNYVNDKESSVDPCVRISENSGIVSQLFRSGVNRLLEGDLPGSKSLSYYIDHPPIKSVVAVPILDHSGHRIGALVMDSTYPNAFTDVTAQALAFVASAISMLDFKGFLSAQKHIALQQYSGLYNYQRKFFQTMTVKDIYKQIISYVRNNVAYERLTILVLNKGTENSGRVVFCEGDDSSEFAEKRFTLDDKGIFVLALMRNRPVERTFSAGFNDYVPRLNDNEKRNLELRQLFVMPIAAEPDSAVADIAICLESKLPRPYSEHEKELLKAFAGVAGFAYDRARKFEHGKEMASRDSMTGLMNKRTLFERLRTEQVRANRMKYDIGVLMMDIDHFKHVNDTYGHNIGDVVINGFAKTISAEIRKDIDVVGRFGGEEFVVGLIDTTAEGMIETAERIRKAIEKLVFDIHQAEPLKVTVSVGAYLVSPGFNDMEKAVKNADLALYKAKESGRNRVVQFEERSLDDTAAN
ncbi:MULTISPECIES: diguanylate cyclase [unclassified Fibrobacter]|uniref:diguanylate cyclase n=1 Tax=unclassified Fibrobacter TaxID=2634177 RepID=UPI000D6D9FF6|nr:MULTISPECIES: diguanylate cyclase [unclassified Fibrobacter]PWJ66205.1 diguanylate cyclase (GGDEF)-like protein [Fibrobacter sp. UWR4]PZW69409.1 diguanylate cyclase (GGDEF)-like protein [Fibrobacter sp. UWR1]